MITILSSIIWIFIIACFILSFAGLVYPIIPSVLVIWAGVLLYQFGINSHKLSWITYTMLVILTIFLFLADYLVNLHFVDRAGGTKWGMRAATVGLIVGGFVIPPFGIIVVPFVLVFIVEILQKKTLHAAIKVAFATLIAFLSGTFAKAVIQLIMIGVFVMSVIF